MSDGYKVVGGSTPAPPPAGGPNLTYTEAAPKVSDKPTHGSKLPDAVHATDKPNHSWKLPSALHLPDAYAWGSKLPDALHLPDKPNHAWKLPDALHVTDRPTHGSRLPSALHVPDAYRITTVGTWPDALHAPTAGRYTLSNLIVGRSGTPDTDRMSDGWNDQASTGTNHGNESLQCKGVSTVPGSDAKEALLQLDMTGVTGVSCPADEVSLLTIVASNSNLLVATNLKVQYATQTTRWFTESTMTWATGRPTPAYADLDPTTSIASGGGFATYSITAAFGDVSSMMGNWVLFKFTTATGAAPDTVTIKSRDDATASNRPKFTATLTIP